MQSPATTKFDIVALLKRPEVLTLLVAVIVGALAATGVPARLGLEIPEAEIGSVVAIFIAVFVGAVFEGKYRGADYAGGFKQLLGSTKFRLAVIALVGMVVNAALTPFGYSLPEETITALGQFVLSAVLGVAGVDGFLSARSRQGK